MKKVYTILILLNTVFCSLKSNDFSHPSIHFSGENITEFTLIGQRCSGTNFVETLIKANFPSYTFNHSTDRTNVPHKHHWPVIDSSNSHPFLQKNDCLFILVVRNPYNWLKSLFSHKELLPHQNRRSFYKFITERFHYPHIPEKTSFANILNARNCEISNFFHIGSKVKNFIFVRYEDVAKNPKEFINFVTEYFNLTKKQDFVAINTYKGFDGYPFKQKRYAPISPANLKLINNSLSWEIEGWMGYSARTSD